MGAIMSNYGGGAMEPEIPVYDPSLPIVVFDEIALCDHAHHEIRLVTNGFAAYAWGEVTSAGTVLRNKVWMTATCNQPGKDSEPCPGQVEFRLDSEAWTADLESRMIFKAHAGVIEWADDDQA